MMFNRKNLISNLEGGSMVQQKDSINFLKLITLIAIFIGLVPLSSDAFGLKDLKNALKPTKVERITYSPKCKKEWKGKTVFIDFDTSRAYWNHRYASGLALDIRDGLIEDFVNDGCFHVQDRRTNKRYAYRIHVAITNPSLKVRRGIIKKVSAAFRLKTYDRKDNLITAKTRRVKYERPMLVVASGDSQSELLENYAYNVSVEIRKAVYKGFRDPTAK